MAVKKSTARKKPSRATKKKATRSEVARVDRGWWNHEKKKKTGTRFCERCHAVYFEGHWHTSPKMSAELREKARNAKMDMCRQCAFIVHGSDLSKVPWEGEVTLDNLIDDKEKAEILATARNVGARAAKRDPEDQIIAIDDRGKRVVITTTENQLASAIGKAVHSAFKGGDLRITWSKDDLPARVYWCRHKGAC